ncbi:alpha/beta fold hydrolase [Corynebacterium sp. Marseille-P4321]|uniref:alpha/beta fold hydrolase n=1 Tax=Corynebacterium sp. Marseille-P4321 TaxID=2736603 RepID=UPI00158864ED|nr:alpha/beta hydrolase [Corynebacterium sp. Marseille-P4321]
MADVLQKRTHTSAHGVVRYWVTPNPNPEQPWLVFLHGMLVDHRLFDGQIEHFADQANLLVWDSPGHNESRPYSLGALSVLGVAGELADILAAENITSPVLVGQSFGGIVSQGLMQLRPELAAGFIGVDTLPLKREFWSGPALVALRGTGPVLRLRPFEKVLRSAPKETAATPQGQAATREMLGEYGKEEYFTIAARTFEELAEAIALELPYGANCPAMLLCGEHDSTAGAKRLNREWSEQEGLPLRWIPGAAHNSPVDNPEAISAEIERFLREEL